MAEFIERYERPRLPVVITGLTESWNASRGEAWSVEKLVEQFGSHRFKVRGFGFTGSGVKRPQAGWNRTRLPPGGESLE